ncbi:MAG: ethanolamine utilization microcompartment protein EutL [Deltaproteobacteria bacterium]|nr:ethanolamine utilization microcompartment protein EutL [Deltaproteobacteria bacterium]
MRGVAGIPEPRLLGLRVEPTPPGLVPIPPTLLAVRQIPNCDPSLAAALGLDPDRHRSLGLLTCDADDALYVALDHCTKAAEVDVVFGHSFYAGAAHASGPLSGEVLGVVAGEHPDHVEEALWALREGLREVAFCRFEGTDGPAFLAHSIGELGRYLSVEAGLPEGSAMAYLIAPPLESMVGIDAALKAADVRLAKHIPPPSETNFGGAFLAGELAEVEAATVAFVEAIREVVRSPLGGLRRPMRLRR